MPRYFYGENAGRPIRVGSRQYAFDILGIGGGTQQGVVAVPDEEVEAFLAIAAKWVSEITMEAYDEAMAKKKANPRSRPSPDLTPPPPPGPPLKGRGAVVVDGDAAPKKPGPEETPVTIDDAVDIGKADAPVSDVKAPKVADSKRQTHKQKRHGK